MDVLGVRVDEVTHAQAISRVREFLQGREPHLIVTPNPEMIVDAQSDTYFKEILNAASLNLCDGVGISLVGWLLQRKKIVRIPGVEFLDDLCALAVEENKSVFLLGAGDARVAAAAADALRIKFPGLRLVGAHPGPSITTKTVNGRQLLSYTDEENDEVIAQIVMARPDVLCVGFGHGKQEKWLAEHLKELPSVMVGIGVGGAFDILAGRLHRAPRWMRGSGLEWLWRLFQEPRRIGRIWKATARFLFLSFTHL